MDSQAFDTILAEVQGDPEGIGYAKALADAHDLAEMAGRFKGVRRDSADKLEVYTLAPLDQTDAVDEVAAQHLAILLNTPRKGATQIPGTHIARSTLVACFDVAEVVPLLPTLSASLDAVTIDGHIEVCKAPVQAILDKLFEACPNTLKAINEACLRTPTRIQELLGIQAHANQSELVDLVIKLT